ncbi:MAG: chorion class high-cysteine HCB protein 13 [Candidatus Fimimorpha sp.]
MSDLAATNCGNCSCENNGGNNCLFLLLILLCCGGFGNGNNGCCGNFNFGDNDCGCNIIIWIILLSCFWGGNGGFCC